MSSRITLPKIARGPRISPRRRTNAPASSSAASAWATPSAPRSTCSPRKRPSSSPNSSAGIVDWNRSPLAPLAKPARRPSRPHQIANVAATLRASSAEFDAILLDVDNGPGAFTDSANAALYSAPGIAAAHASLNPGGTLAILSAHEDPKFAHRLRSANLPSTQNTPAPTPTKAPATPSTSPRNRSCNFAAGWLFPHNSNLVLGRNNKTSRP